MSFVNLQLQNLVAFMSVIFMSVYLYVYVSVCLSLCIMYVCMSVCLSVCMSVYMYVCLTSDDNNQYCVPDTVHKIDLI